MARYFIGENGFYPAWAKGPSRWVIQRVFTTVRGFMEATDSLARPSVSYESLIWVPSRRGIKAIFSPGEDQASRAMLELQQVPLVCSKCEWEGHNPSIDASARSRGPSDWRLRCPSCSQLVSPVLDSLDATRIVKQWVARGRPELDQPGAAALTVSIRPITDLEAWIQSYEPMANELAYVGQQLWPTFAEFISMCSNPDISWNKTAMTDWEEAIANLEVFIISTSRSTADGISSELTGQTKEAIPLETNMRIRLEVMSLLLHVTNRYVFARGGADVRADVQDAIAMRINASIAESSFDLLLAEGFDADPWLDSMGNALFDLTNDGEMEYGNCERIGSEAEDEHLNESTVVSTFVRKVSQLLELSGHRAAEHWLYAAAVDSLAESELELRSKEIVRLLGRL